MMNPLAQFAPRGGPAATLYLVGVLWFLVAAMVVFVVQTFRMLPVDTEPDA